MIKQRSKYSPEAREKIQFATSSSSIGSFLVAQSKQGVCAILIGNNPNDLKQDLQNRFSYAILVQDAENLKKTLESVQKCIEDPQHKLTITLDIQGSPFQKRVWEALCDIPKGTVASYTDIAIKIGLPNAIRAVAGACAANPLAIVIPCHRVIRSDGKISGYRWGVKIKRQLLQKEGVVAFCENKIQ